MITGVEETGMVPQVMEEAMLKTWLLPTYQYDRPVHEYHIKPAVQL